MASMLRRDFLRLSGLAGAVLLSPAGRALTTLSPAGAAGAPPQTGFEQSNGASWTTHAQELQFLGDVAAASPRVRITEIGRTLQGRPLHLVAIGDPAPPEADVAKQAPITLFICSQHGNEPAGRETGLKLIRDLAFTTDPTLVKQLSEQTILVIPAANPDGRNANTRGNSQGVDINRDHLNLTSLEARAMAAVVRDWSPDLVLDLHEYGPSIPVLYDDDILYLWPRNLNADPAVRGLSRRLCLDYIKPGAESAGYTADEYGLATVDNKTVRVGDSNANQTAGDHDEGICRNAMGLRHSLGILVESAVTQNPRHGADELSTAGLNRRRVASQVRVTADTLRFMREEGRVAKYASDDAPIQSAKSARPVYFGGADKDAPTAAEIQDPAPIAYRLTAADAAKVATAFALHGIASGPDGNGGVLVSMRQAARPVIPLLLDPRGARKSVSGTAIYESS
jgi:hypothetical protein